MAKKKNKGDESRIEMGRGMICRRTLSSLMTRLPLTSNAHAQLRAKPSQDAQCEIRRQEATNTFALGSGGRLLAMDALLFSQTRRTRKISPLLI